MNAAPRNKVSRSCIQQPLDGQAGQALGFQFSRWRCVDRDGYQPLFMAASYASVISTRGTD